MGEQNRYLMSGRYDTSEWFDVVVWLEETWQDAIHTWLNAYWHEGWGKDGGYHVISETPSEDGRSGMIEIKEDPGTNAWKLKKVKATLIED